VLRSLIVIYFDPNTADNANLRQTLNYFLPVYFHSNLSNQSRLQRDFITILQQLLQLHESTDQSRHMVSPAVFTNLLLEWSDPRKNISFESELATNDDIHNGHVLVAIEAMEKCLDKSCHSMFEL
jgi:condensin complex subunit 3